VKKGRSEADASRVSKPPSAAAGQTTREPSREAPPALSYVVPTIGVSEHLAECLASIYRDGLRLDRPAELVIVWQAPSAAETEGAGDAADGGGSAALRQLCGRLASARPGAIERAPRIVELPRPAGFARAANDGIAVSSGDWIALVNDDVVLRAEWARRLLEAADGASRVAAAQGINLVAGGGSGDGEKARVDAAGLAWNRRLQAIQLDRGATVEAAEPVRRVYGVSATAAIYSRAALAKASGASDALRPFEERLDSYYEDVELADRLRAAGYVALLVPAARAVHAGALSSRSPRAARRRTRRVYANRLLVAARRLGRGFWLNLPVLLGRDVVDALKRPATAPKPGDLEPPGIVDLACAWGRAMRLLPRFAHFGRGIRR
jgi:GT2 family glycosyltransferase